MTARYNIYTACISLLLLLSGTALACGPSLYYDESRFALFRPGIDGQSGLEPFYYSERFLNSNAPDPAGLDYLRNCREWQALTGAQVTIPDIYEVQYKTHPDDFAFGLETGDWKGLEDNSFINWLKRPANKEAMAYMALAKQSEHAQFYGDDPWANSDNGGKNFGLMQEVMEKAAARYGGASSAFLRERYAFQHIKTLYYLDPDADSIAHIFNRHLARSKSVVKGWAELYYGMSLSGNARTHMLLQSFHHSEEKKVFCYNQLQVYQIDIPYNPEVRQMASFKQRTNQAVWYRHIRTTLSPRT
ncbi:MAG: hypothetical protein EOO61_10035 [Hymenobacter sp.]|nr:MAG: hypothetical protein EOO61_10035 [Hymenobacter sp.]